MKLLLCCENYPPSVGGVQEVMRQVAERLATRGHQVTVYTTAHPARPPDATIAGVRVVSFSASGNLVRGMSGDLDRYRASVLGGRFDAVLVKAAQQWTFDALVPVLGELESRKVFIPCGFSGLYERRYRGYYQRMPEWLRAFDALVFYSGTYRDIEFARTHGISRVFVVPNGVDEREFGMAQAGAIGSELGVDAGDLLLLSVGTLVAGKGHWETLRAFELARLPGPATLVINGNDPYGSGAGALRRVAAHVRDRHLPLSVLAARLNRRHAGRKRVLITDLRRADLVRAYRAADLFLFASKVEYSPLVLFEAAAAGTPFLSPPVGNAREIAEWTSGGWLYEASTDEQGRALIDPSILAERIERCFAAGSTLQATGEAGRKGVLAGGYTWDAIVPRYEAILAGAPTEKVRACVEMDEGASATRAGES